MNKYASTLDHSTLIALLIYPLFIGDRVSDIIVSLMQLQESSKKKFFLRISDGPFSNQVF